MGLDFGWRRVGKRGAAGWERALQAANRWTVWVEQRDPASHQGAAVGWVRRYRAADGQLYAVLLAAYLLLTMVPAALVAASYVWDNPQQLSDHLVQRLGLHAATARLVQTVLVGSSEHHFVSALLAILNLVLFGMGFPRVLQLAHSRSWGIDLEKNALRDQARYMSVLLALLGMGALYLFQLRHLRSEPTAVGIVLDAAWIAAALAFFLWAPRLLLHARVAWTDLLPGAVFTVAGLIALRLVSTLVFARWLDTYTRTYGALGVIMACFFWLIVITTILTLAAALSPALAHRRTVLARQP